MSELNQRARARLPVLVVQSQIPKPTILMVSSPNVSPLAVAVGFPALAPEMTLPALTPLVITSTIPGIEQPVYAPPLVVTTTIKTPLIGGEFLVDVMSEASLIGYWRLNETSGSVATDAQSGNHGTYQSTPTLGNAGPFMLSDSLAALLEGGTKYVSVPDSVLLDTGNTFTVECIVKRTAAGVFHPLVSKQVGSYVVYFNVDNTLALDTPFGGGGKITTGTFVDTASFHHVVFTKSGSTTHIYYDGNDETLTGSDVTIGNSASTLLFGRHDDTNPGSPGNIYLCEVAIYSAALSGATVLAHYNDAVTDGL